MINLLVNYHHLCHQKALSKHLHFTWGWTRHSRLTIQPRPILTSLERNSTDKLIGKLEQEESIRLHNHIEEEREIQDAETESESSRTRVKANGECIYKDMMQ